MNLDLLESWQYELPTDLIASRPTPLRDESKLLVVDRTTGQVSHKLIRELPELLQPNDLMVFNNTQVLPARLFGFRTNTGGKWEGLFVREVCPGEWIILSETRGKLLPGETITIVPAYAVVSSGESATALLSPRCDENMVVRLIEKQPDGSWHVAIPLGESALETLQRYGSLPLPPYMGRRLADETDRDRYQTKFASEPGAVAAPTAGLHFTEELFAACHRRGINRTEVTLHVGIGTFRPVNVANLNDHDMHYEWCRMPQQAADAIQQTRQQGGRVVGVGTTSVRTLESAAIHGNGLATSWEGETNLFIRPGFSFQVIDRLLTNFHLPGSTLIVLVAAFMGYDLTMEVYKKAVEERYRFYSYGDAMLIL